MNETVNNVKTRAWSELARRLRNEPAKFPTGALVKLVVDMAKLELSHERAEKPDVPNKQTNILAIIGSADSLPPERRAEIHAAMSAQVDDWTAVLRELEPAKEEDNGRLPRG